MINLAVMFGGKSFEHDISVITGVQLLSHANLPNYNVMPIYVNKDGRWFVGDELFDLDNFANGFRKLKEVILSPSSKSLYLVKGKSLKKYKDIDVAILCFHGGLGEGGGVSALLDFSGIPYTSADMTAGAVCLDKSIFKFLMKGLDIPHIDGEVVWENDFLVDKEVVKERLGYLGYPLIIKPSKLGSSIGIEVVKNETELYDKLQSAFAFDKKVLVEKFVDIEKEVNIALVSNKGEMIFSNTEEPVASSDILSFDDKYRENSGGFESIKRIMPAKISNEAEIEIKDIASKIYKNLDLFGAVRFDFIIDKNNKVYINEVNTIPGSMANYLFDKDKLPYEGLIEILVSNATKRAVENSKKENDFDLDILKSGVKLLEK